MPDQKSVSIGTKGMISDLHEFGLGAETYAFALNSMNSDRSGQEPFLQNEGSTICAVEFPPNYKVVGFREIPELRRTIYFLTNPITGLGQIGEVINCNYNDVTDKIEKVFCENCPEYKGTEQTPLEKSVEECYCQYLLTVSSPCFAFDINHPVDIEYKLTNCGINLYFVDDLNERRFLYFKYTNDDSTQPIVLSDDFKVCTTVQGCICPPDYVFDEDLLTCTKTTITPIEPSIDQRVACAQQDDAYTNFGVALYSTFNANGTGTSAIYHTTDLYWSNPSVNSTDGVLNRTALWACNANNTPQSGTYQPLNENIGYIFPIVVPVTKTYYVGIAGDNKVRIRVDCATVVDMDANAVGTQYGVGTPAAFKYWHIYPISLSAGRHIIELTGVNFGSVAGFGAEIYDNTSAQIIAATAGAGLNILFSTHDVRGQLLQVSSTFSGSCPSGVCLDIDPNGNLICIDSETIPADCDDCRAPICTSDLDCDKLKLHSRHDRPCIEFLEFVNGGNLKAGDYQVLISYADIFGNPTSNYFPSSQIAPLFRDQITFETNYVTSKALSFNIKNLRSDGLYQYYNVVIAKTIDNFTEFILAGTFSTKQTSYIYTGFEKAPKLLSPQEVFFRYPFYQKARGVTSANNYLFYSGVTEYKTLNLQPVANAIKLQWQTVALKEKAYYDPRNTFYYRTNLRDEVYPYAVVFEYGNGRETCAFHIPGRASIPSDLDIIDNEDVLTDTSCDPVVRNKRWQIYNTGSVVGGDYTYSDDCFTGKCWEYGEFAYWESTSLYPHIREIWGDLCGTPIRHPKFPDSCITHIHDGLDGTKGYATSNYIFPIGVKIDHNSVNVALNQAVTDNLITQAERDSIVSYRIVRGNRVGNKSIDAKGLIYNMWKYTRESVDYHYANYPYNDLRPDDFLAPTKATYAGSTTSPPTPTTYNGDNKRYTFHSPDVHFVNSGLGNILKIETEEYGKSEGYFTHSECQARHKFLSTAARAIALGFGVAAALSATGAKECKVIVKQANTIETRATATDPGTVNIQWNTGFYTTYDEFGLPIGVPILGKTEQETTCKGEPYQVFNGNVIVQGILLAGGAGLGIVIQKVLLGIIEADKVIQTMKTLIPYKNYSTQYNSVGKYNNYKCVGEGNKNRRLEKTAYLDPIIQNIDEPSADPTTAFNTIKINNWQRESSVYLKTSATLDLPTVTDNSRTTLDEHFAALSDSDRYDKLNERFIRDISSYYVSIKRFVPNQYGQLCNIEYLETTGCSFVLNTTYTGCNAMVFGGDTFINRFALKRKMPFFIHTMCGVQDGTDVKYSELGNVAFPNYYFDTEKPFFERFDSISSFTSFFTGATLQDLLGTNDTRLDAKTSKFFYQNGYAHLFSYGVPYFFVESDINVDFRHGQNNKEKDFYPHADLKEWLEEENVPIREDNYYFYNTTYSKQNKETPICTSCILNINDLTCQYKNDNRLIYSEPLDTEHRNDNWLIFKANNYYDFPLKLGRLITADGIENDKVLVRLEKGTQIFSAYNTIQATEENIQVGTGGIFQSRPRDIAVTDLGYAGTQHKDILHTEYGQLWADAERGQIFNLATGGGQADEISKDGMKSWFKENLPFRIRKDFPELSLEDIDNNLNGVGLHYCFDKRFNRLIITKLDYKKINENVSYDPTSKTFTSNGTTVSLKDTKYFCDKSWTISYNPFSKSWTSFHSYTPNFYVEHIDTFDSGVTDSSGNQKIYTHNATNKSYQVFYGKIHPFIVELQGKPNMYSSTLKSIEYSLDVIRYHNEFDTFYNSLKTFNKAIIYNESQTSGLLTLKVGDPEDLTETSIYPKQILNGYEIIVTNSENIWSFNDFWDVTKSKVNNVPIFNYDCNNVNKQLNPKALDYNKDDFDRGGIRSKMCKIRLINDKESLYKYIIGFAQLQQKQSFR